MKDTEHNLFTRWVEVTLWDGRVMKGSKRPTLVRKGNTPPALSTERALEWKTLYENQGMPVKAVNFRYRLR